MKMSDYYAHAPPQLSFHVELSSLKNLKFRRVLVTNNNPLL